MHITAQQLRTEAQNADAKIRALQAAQAAGPQKEDQNANEDKLNFLVREVLSIRTELERRAERGDQGDFKKPAKYSVPSKLEGTGPGEEANFVN